MDTPGVIRLISILILVLLSGFFSSAETALTTVNRIRMRSLEEEGNKRARTVLKILDNHNKMISTILIGNNIVNIAASSITTTFSIRFGISIGIATGLLTFVVLVIGEIVPKTWAMANADKLSLLYCDIILFLMRILTPAIFIVNIFASFIQKIMKIDTEKKPTITESEIKTYVDVGHEDGVIESEEREMILNVFDFSDAQAKDIMIPRVNIISISLEASYEDILEVFRESMYTRIPVYQDDKDNIIGLINIKDILLSENRSDFHVESILREGYYTYEFKKVSDLMYEMRAKSQSLAFVLNEYGDTVGMITLEDMLEEIVGDIRDEYDEDEEDFIQKLDEKNYLVEASMKLDDINDALGTQLDSEEYDSIGGLIIARLEDIPEDEEEVSLENGIKLQVKGIDQNRIVKVLLTLPDEEITSSDEDAEQNASKVAENTDDVK